MALGWIGSIAAFGFVVRKPKTRCGPGSGFDFGPRSPLYSVQIPAKENSARSSFRANQTTSFFPVAGLSQARTRKNLMQARGSGFRV